MAVETICSVELPVGECLNIRKNRFTAWDADGEEGTGSVDGAKFRTDGSVDGTEGTGSVDGAKFRTDGSVDGTEGTGAKHQTSGNGRRLSIVTGIHGDELEGQYVCFEVARRIRENPELLNGTVDIYPAMNPLGIDSMTRGIPGFDLDMNRIFPGSSTGAMTEYVADRIINDLSGSDLCIDIHASNIFLTEIPQIRINELHQDELVPWARLMNVDFVWIHGASTVLESTLAYSLNSTGTPTLVVEMGVGMRITKAYCEQLVDGIFNTMCRLGIWLGETAPVRGPLVANESDGVVFFNAPRAGVFVSSARHWEHLNAGDEVGRIVDPLRGEVLARIVTECSGILFTIREYPVVDEGSLVGRLLKR